MSEKPNFCKPGVMSTCSAKDCKEQESCEFYERASRENRCMHFAFDQYCGSFKAQDDAKKKLDSTKKLQEENQKKIDEETAIEDEKQETIIPV
jgi:hypothetical protein